MGDLFFALGYDDLRFDVPRSGRELDILGIHRFENRRLVAECKAHKEKIGGGDINKFRGAFIAEEKRIKDVPASAYFVSLSGFTGTALEQEKDLGNEAVILLDSERVINELVQTHILVSHMDAMEQAGHSAEHAGLNEAALDGAQLLGHEYGYLWAVFYSQAKQRNHFALIHAEGRPLAESLARDVIEADRNCNGTLYKLKYLAPPPPSPDRAALARAMFDRYCQWVGEECGYIQLDGLPADSDLSATRIRLERLLVPLKILTEDEDGSEQKKLVGEFMRSVFRFALLATPGAGKSTLLKRLAISYATPDRRTEVDDDLPERDWLPLFLRCRELRDRAHRPILELLDDLPQHAGMNADEAAAFRDRAHEYLRSGRALFLVDGLDEISDVGARQTFAKHLRTFLGMFPHVALIVTSREAGFRQVAGVVASACTQANIAPFDKEDVWRLCESWFVEVVGDNDQVRSDAHELAQTIWENRRIRSLAENPLMLTTLLVVKRWIGELPRSRAKLYEGAVHVLIRTWNVEGYEPMDEDETLAQLSYVACSMMVAGQQQIEHTALLNLLQDARRELDAELQFARVSPQQFIERIEYRSSLLMQTGHDWANGEIQPVYEFRHLTFQEYLAARGFVKEQYPGRDEGRSLTNILEPHLRDEHWLEVVPLAAVMAGRQADELITRLTEECDILERMGTHASVTVRHRSIALLRQCLLDEVQLTSATLRSALRQIARHSSEDQMLGSVLDLGQGKFGEILYDVVQESYFGRNEDWEQFHFPIVQLAKAALFTRQLEGSSKNVKETLVRALTAGSRDEKFRAARLCLEIVFGADKNDAITELDGVHGPFTALRNALCQALSLEDVPTAQAACKALAQFGYSRLTSIPPETPALLCLYQLWRKANPRELARSAALAFATQPLLPRDAIEKEAWGDCDAWFENTKDVDTSASLVLAWYRRAPWSDSELARRVGDAGAWSSTARDILVTLGEHGRCILKEWCHETT